MTCVYHLDQEPGIEMTVCEALGLFPTQIQSEVHRLISLVVVAFAARLALHVEC